MKKFALTTVLLLVVSALVVPQSSAGQIKLPIIRTSTTTVDFGQVPFGAGTMVIVTVYNDGEMPLIVENVRTHDPEFAVLMPRKRIAGGSSAPLNVYFLPPSTGTFTGACGILSNAANATMYNLTLTGEGI